MLDTIVLSLDQPQFEVLEPGRFSPSAQGLLAPPYYPLGARGNFQCTQNPTKADLEGGRYLPRLTLTKRTSRAGFAVTLRVEFSAPKLIFGNNFDELRSMDFDRVRIALRTALLAMGIRVAEPTLAAARVSAIHFSKNIALRDFTTVSMAMGELERIDLTARLDLAKTDYRNGGHAIRYHANSYEVAFYDKVKDLLQARISQKRSIEPVPLDDPAPDVAFALSRVAGEQRRAVVDLGEAATELGVALHFGQEVGQEQHLAVARPRGQRILRVAPVADDEARVLDPVLAAHSFEIAFPALPVKADSTA